MAQIEIKRAADGQPMARRMDGKPLTPKEREEARRRIEAEYPLELSPGVQVGITVDDVLREFPGARVIQGELERLHGDQGTLDLKR